MHIGFILIFNIMSIVKMFMLSIEKPSYLNLYETQG